MKCIICGETRCDPDSAYCDLHKQEQELISIQDSCWREEDR